MATLNRCSRTFTWWRFPLGDIAGIGATIQDKLESLRIMGGRLKFLHTQDALLLLRYSLAIPKLSYTLRTAPCFLSPELQTYDGLLRSITSNITNISFQDSDPAWTQASLPVKHGGLGIQSAVQLASSAFLASAAGSSWSPRSSHDTCNRPLS